MASTNTMYTNVRLNISGFSETAPMAAEPAIPSPIPAPKKARPATMAAARDESLWVPVVWP